MTQPDPQLPSTFLSLVRHPVKMRLFLLRKLPAAYFSGLHIVSATESVCTVSVPYRWFTQNPFGSTYFACLAMAAELSTGVLAMNQVWRRTPSVSMLVTAMESRFYKKAKDLTLFTCSDGQLIKNAVAAAFAGGAGQAVKVHSEGRNASGELVAEFWFEWSFRAKVETRDLAVHVASGKV